MRSGSESVARQLLADRFMQAAGVLTLLAAIPYLVPFLSPDNQRVYGAHFASTPLHILTMVAAFAAALRQTTRHARTFWLLIGTAAGCWTLNKFIAIGLDDRTQLVVLELATDVLFVGFYLFTAIALEQEPHHQSRPRRLLAIRRGATTVLAFSLLIYFSVLPAALNREAYLTWLPSLLLYVVLDIYILVRLTALWRACEEPVWKNTYLLLTATAMLWLGTDLVEALASMEVITLAPPGHPIDILFVPNFFALIAATRLGPAPERDPGEDPTTEEAWQAPTGYGGGPLVASILILPFLHYALYATGILDEATRSAREGWVAISLVALAFMGIIYQRRLIEENLRLWNRSQAMVQRLQAGERLEAIGRLAGGIAHDFNNILTVVIGNADLARTSLAPEELKTRGYVDSLTSAASRGAALVKKLLGFGRRDLVVAEPTDLSDFAKRIGKEWSRVLPETLTLVFHGAPDTPTVMIDPSVFEPVVVNLLTNARDAMPLGGRVKIETLKMEVTAEAGERLRVTPGPYGCLRIEDAGIGMDKKTLDRVFEPFFTTKPMGAGAGMGLSTAYGIVKQHDGVIEVESTPGEGTVVTICLPECSAPPEPTLVVTAHDHALVSGNETILLAEDEPAVRDIASNLLEAHGYTVVTAGNGDEAYRIFEERGESIDLIISDVVMPLLGGPALLNKIRQTHRDVPFMFVSGHAPESYLAHGELDPTVPFVTKPWNNDELLRKIQQILHTRRPVAN